MTFSCAARLQGTAGGNDPADCDWPQCGCEQTKGFMMVERCTTWQPIASAPKDQPILLTSRWASNPCICEWRKKEWVVLNEGGGWTLNSQGDTWTEYATFSDPSHWMDVPLNPTFDD